MSKPFQQNLECVEPSEEDIYQRAIRRPLGKKIDRAILLLQEYEKFALNLSPDGYHLAFSGGKDSIVIKELALMAGVKFEAVYSNVTIDPPELVRFIKKHHSEVRWEGKGRKPLPLMMEDKSCGPPTRVARWCCEKYKESGGDGLFKILGVRGPESARRKGMWREVIANRRMGQILCNIVHWTDADVWAFIKARNLPYCSLYDDGFKRLGCIGCPLGGPKQQALEFARWPRYERLWRRGFDLYWKRWKGVPRRDGDPRWIERFDNLEDFWQWWISGVANQGGDADCQMWLW